MLEPFRNADQLEFKPKFIERYTALTDWEEFKRYNLSFLRRSIRVNTLIADVKETVESNGLRLGTNTYPVVTRAFGLNILTKRCWQRGNIISAKFMCRKPRA